MRGRARLRPLLLAGAVSAPATPPLASLPLFKHVENMGPTGGYNASFGPSHQFVCTILEPIHHIARHLLIKAEEWKVPNGIYGACDFEGSPCAWFGGFESGSISLLLDALTHFRRQSVVVGSPLLAVEVGDGAPAAAEFNRAAYDGKWTLTRLDESALASRMAGERGPALDLLLVASSEAVWRTLQPAVLGALRPAVVLFRHDALGEARRAKLRDHLRAQGAPYSCYGHLMGLCTCPTCRRPSLSIPYAHAQGQPSPPLHLPHAHAVAFPMRRVQPFTTE